MDTESSNNYQWEKLININGSLIVMSKQKSDTISYRIMYVHKFSFFTPKKLLDSEEFNIKFKVITEISKTADKLKYYRYKHGLLQIDVANYIGINQSTYISYESKNRNYYPIEKLIKIANLYNINVLDLLDEYNLFLYYGQGKTLKNLRISLGITQKSFAEIIGVSRRTYRMWETDKVVMSKSTYQKVFKTDFSKTKAF